ncbi:MAG: type II secretion system protein GspG [Acidobacteria bacterium]|nr:type II secretion system protein GspG [Acidobacteriota bacterium]MCZ6768268.1 type II secretion system protein GspG [Acidobacteriota bacterium]
MKRFGLVLILLGSFACGKSVERQIQDQIRTFGNASLADKQVEVNNVREMGDHAVAEVRITTAVRLIKKDGKWLIEEFRIGDRRWERVEHILAVINEQRTETTLQQMSLIREGIRRYANLNNQAPQVESFEELMDILSPQFQSRIVRIDSWSNPFFYRPMGVNDYALSSAGPDGHLGTPDDLVVGIQ